MKSTCESGYYIQILINFILINPRYYVYFIIINQKDIIIIFIYNKFIKNLRYYF